MKPAVVPLILFMMLNGDLIADLGNFGRDVKREQNENRAKKDYKQPYRDKESGSTDEGSCIGAAISGILEVIFSPSSEDERRKKRDQKYSDEINSRRDVEGAVDDGDGCVITDAALIGGYTSYPYSDTMHANFIVRQQQKNLDQDGDASQPLKAKYAQIDGPVFGIRVWI